MKMNWGVKIVIGLGSFMLLIVAFGVYMVQKNTDSLEEPDYYEKSLSFDRVYERRQDLIMDHAEPTIAIVNDSLRITFVQAANQGKLSFKRPADRMLDLTIPFATTNFSFVVPLHTFVRGNWQLEIAWDSANKAYIFDRSLYF